MRRLTTGALAAAGIAGLWIGLTALTGKTYHLAPLIAALAPGVSARMLGPSGRSFPLAAAAAFLGAGVAAVGWALIVAWGIEPSATLVDDQPGGVAGEVVAGIVIGSAIGAAALTPARARAGARGARGRSGRRLRRRRRAARGDAGLSSDGRYWARTSDPQLVDPKHGVLDVSVHFGRLPAKPHQRRAKAHAKRSAISVRFRPFAVPTGTK